MSYSRWGSSVFYTFWKSSSPPGKENQILVVDCSDSYEFTYKELSQNMRSCLDRIEGYSWSQMIDLKGYIAQFLLDVDLEFDRKKRSCVTCGHPKSAHIYEEGACRPGFACSCHHYVPQKDPGDITHHKGMNPLNLKISPRTAFYEARDKEKLIQAGLPTGFEALSVGHEKGQFALIPLDESSMENAIELVRRWNSFEEMREDLNRTTEFILSTWNGDRAEWVKEIRKKWRIT